MGIFPSYKLSRDVLTVFEKVVDEDPIGINSPVAFFLHLPGTNMQTLYTSFEVCRLV